MSLQRLVVDGQAEGQFVGRSAAVLLRFEVEEARVVALIGPLEEFDQAAVNACAVGQACRRP